MQSNRTTLVENSDRTSSSGLKLNLKPFSRIIQKIQHYRFSRGEATPTAQLHVLLLVRRVSNDLDRGLFQYDMDRRTIITSIGENLQQSRVMRLEFS